MHAVWIAVCLWPVTIVVNAQANQGVSHPSQSSAILAAPLAWDTLIIRPFADSDRKIDFKLTTSWIPGERHQGMCRYKLSALPAALTLAQRAREMDIPGATDKMVRRAHACSFELQLYDADGFILRKVPE